MAKIERDPSLAQNLDIDSNNIEELLVFSYFLKIFKLVIIILNLSYLFGVLWICLCEAVFDFQYDIDIDTYLQNTFEEAPDLFLTYFSLNEKNWMETLIISSYFAFTSLSTVGFGDYHPRGNIERFVTAFILLFGVAIFSYIMGNFIDILAEFKEFNKDIGDGDSLSQFFGTMKYFNGQKMIEDSLKRQIEDLFEYRWRTDRLAAFKEDHDLNLFTQLPEVV